MNNFFKGGDIPPEYDPELNDQEKLLFRRLAAIDRKALNSGTPQPAAPFKGAHQTNKMKQCWLAFVQFHENRYNGSDPRVVYEFFRESQQLCPIEFLKEWNQQIVDKTFPGFPRRGKLKPKI